MGEPISNQPTQRGSTRSQPDYITCRDDIDVSQIVEPKGKGIDQAGWYWEKSPGTENAYYKCYYWYKVDMSPSELATHRPRCPGRAVSPPRSSPSPKRARTSARKCAPSSARIAEPLNPHVETTTKHAPPKPPPPPSERSDACSRGVGYRLDLQRMGNTPRAEGRLDADATASHALETTAKSGQPRSTDLAESCEPAVKRARNNSTGDPPDVPGAGRRMFGPDYRKCPKAASVAPHMRPPPAVLHPGASAAAVAVSRVSRGAAIPEMPELAPVAHASKQIRAKQIMPPSRGVSSETAPETNRAALAYATPASHIPPSAAPMIAPDDRDQPDADGEVHCPLWAQKVLDQLQDGSIMTTRGHEQDDPEDQCELASPTPRLLTAGGYNRQH